MRAEVWAAANGVLATVVAVVLHELAHGWAARAMGDATAARAGRLTLNPLAHVDRFGTVLLPLLLVVSQLATIGRVQFMFGWAKPVPIDAAALHVGRWREPRRLMALVALAGPAMNFSLAFIAALTLYAGRAVDFLSYFILVNLVLGLFNLIPLPPMDGGRVAVGVLPLPAARWLAGFEKQGILLVLLLLFIVPAVLGQLGWRFDPLQATLNAVLPWADGVVMRLAGHGDGG